MFYFSFRQGSARSAVSPSVSPMVKNNYSSGRNDDRIANPKTLTFKNSLLKSQTESSRTVF